MADQKSRAYRMSRVTFWKFWGVIGPLIALWIICAIYGG
jgi:hypothetical protein